MDFTDEDFNSLVSIILYHIRNRMQDGLLSHPVIVGIDGYSGSGKSTLGRKLTADLSSRHIMCTQIELENYIPGWNGLIPGVSLVARHILAPLKRKGWATARKWNWQESHWNRASRIPAIGSVQVLLLVGCGATSPACSPYLDAQVWLHCGERQRRLRVLRREGNPLRWWVMWHRQELLVDGDFCGVWRGSCVREVEGFPDALGKS